jgi:hypothetical protein
MSPARRYPIHVRAAIQDDPPQAAAVTLRQKLRQRVPGRLRLTRNF